MPALTTYIDSLQFFPKSSLWNKLCEFFNLPGDCPTMTLTKLSPQKFKTNSKLKIFMESIILLRNLCNKSMVDVE